jgi:hypothetical protein
MRRRSFRSGAAVRVAAGVIEGGADVGGDTASKDAPRPDHVYAERVADVLPDTTTVEDGAAETCVPETAAVACGSQCVDSVPNGCSGMIDCTMNPCTCDESTQMCVSSCVPDGHSVLVLSDCKHCCSTKCSTGTTCCVREIPALACGTLCAGTAPDGCGGNVACSMNSYTTCGSDLDCAGHFCDVSKGVCVVCVPPDHNVAVAGDCSDCCSHGCSTANTCSF